MDSNLTRYGVFSILIHWLLALATAALLGLGWYLRFSPATADEQAFSRISSFPGAHHRRSSRSRDFVEAVVWRAGLSPADAALAAIDWRVDKRAALSGARGRDGQRLSAPNLHRIARAVVGMAPALMGRTGRPSGGRVREHSRNRRLCARRPHCRPYRTRHREQFRLSGLRQQNAARKEPSAGRSCPCFADERPVGRQNRAASRRPNAPPGLDQILD